MKAAVLKGVGEIVLEDIPVPNVGSDEALVEVKYCGICGTDVAAYKVPGFLQPGTFLGHEFSGIITKIGRDVRGWEVGTRVAVTPNYQCGKCYRCTHGWVNLCERMMECIGCVTQYGGAFAKYVKVPQAEKRLHVLPDEVSFEEGALVDPLATALHAIRISSFRSGDLTAVLGAGPVGLGVIFFLRRSNAGLVIVIEVNERRRQLARKFGADYILNPNTTPNLREEILKLTNGRGVNQVFDCSGAPRAFQSAVGFLRPRGQIVVIGLIFDEVAIQPATFTLGEFSLQGSVIYSDEFQTVIDLLRKERFPIEEMVTRIRLDEIAEKGFEVLATPNCDKVKILVSPD